MCFIQSIDDIKNEYSELLKITSVLFYRHSISILLEQNNTFFQKLFVVFSFDNINI